MSAPVLVFKPLAHIVTFWRPGSHDWTWADEYADLMGRDADKTAAIEQRVNSEGIDFLDYLAPVLLGNDGRVWDGHHRICIAIKRRIPGLMVELARDERADAAHPDPDDGEGLTEDEREVLLAGYLADIADNEAAVERIIAARERAAEEHGAERERERIAQDLERQRGDGEVIAYAAGLVMGYQATRADRTEAGGAP
jgi:hypothetical protein